MAHDCQRQHLANSVTKVTSQVWAGKRNMASRDATPQIIYVKMGGLRGEENMMDKVQAPE